MFAYCNNNAIAFIDSAGELPFANYLVSDGPGDWENSFVPIRSCKYGVGEGDGTVSIGASFACQGIGYVSIDYSFDGKGKDALLFTIGFDGGTPALGFDLHVTTTNAPTVDDLLGQSISFGGGVLGFGYDRVLLINSETKHAKYSGNSYSIGLRSFCPVPAEIHAICSNTSNIWEWFK